MSVTVMLRLKYQPAELQSGKGQIAARAQQDQRLATLFHSQSYCLLRPPTQQSNCLPASPEEDWNQISVARLIRERNERNETHFPHSASYGVLAVHPEFRFRWFRWFRKIPPSGLSLDTTSRHW